jgi:hypothetical protein
VWKLGKPRARRTNYLAFLPLPYKQEAAGSNSALPTIPRQSTNPFVRLACVGAVCIRRKGIGEILVLKTRVKVKFFGTNSVSITGLSDDK